MDAKLDFDKIIIVSNGATNRVRTHKLLDAASLEYQYVVHDAEEAAGVVAAGVTHDKLVVTNLQPAKEQSLIDKRNWILDQLPDGEWMTGMDDNIELFQIVGSNYYPFYERLDTDDGNNWRPEYRHTLPAQDLWGYIQGLKDQCNNTGTVYGGFASCENPMFRKTKWSLGKFVKTKAYVIKKVPGMTFKTNYAHDSYMSAWVMAHYGRVAVNNWIYPKSPMYEPGGLGNAKDRAPFLDAACQVTIDEFPGLVERSPGANSALKFMKTSQKSVENWRRANGYLV